MSDFGPLVETQWLAERLGRDDLKIIDGSWRMPGASPAQIDYNTRHISGAVFFDIDQISDQQSTLPHMAPDPAFFAEAIGALGISTRDAVIVYDDQGCFSAARVWWTFRLMGHKKVAVLNGGLPKWLDEGYAVTNDLTTVIAVDYETSPHLRHVCDAANIRQRLQADDTLILDARPAQRFQGAAPEPREGLRSGAMPGAVNLPFGDLFKNDKTFLDQPTLSAQLERAGIKPEMEVITTCGSGVTAAVLSLALEIIGHPNHTLYDGSWAEWGSVDNPAKEFPVIANTK